MSPRQSQARTGDSGQHPSHQLLSSAIRGSLRRPCPGIVVVVVTTAVVVMDERALDREDAAKRIVGEGQPAAAHGGWRPHGLWVAGRLGVAGDAKGGCRVVVPLGPRRQRVGALHYGEERITTAAAAHAHVLHSSTSDHKPPYGSFLEQRVLRRLQHLRGIEQHFGGHVPRFRVHHIQVLWLLLLLLLLHLGMMLKSRRRSTVHRGRGRGHQGHWRWGYYHCRRGIRMQHEFRTILLKYIRWHVQAKIDPKQKVHFQTVHFADKNASNLGIIRIVVVGIVKELGGQQDSRNDNSVHIEFRQKEVAPLDQSINVNQCKDETLVGAGRVFVYPGRVGNSKKMTRSVEGTRLL